VPFSELLSSWPSYQRAYDVDRTKWRSPALEPEPDKNGRTEVEISPGDRVKELGPSHQFGAGDKKPRTMPGPSLLHGEKLVARRNRGCAPAEAVVDPQFQHPRGLGGPAVPEVAGQAFNLARHFDQISLLAVVQNAVAAVDHRAGPTANAIAHPGPLQGPPK
jgi:hypothetical protein